jgi:hypothetical protein
MIVLKRRYMHKDIISEVFAPSYFFVSLISLPIEFVNCVISVLVADSNLRFLIFLTVCQLCWDFFFLDLDTCLPIMNKLIENPNKFSGFPCGT